ncbi:MAG: SDR family NAD(P)-dependent oxidoreductase [Bacteroidota bacterium]
MKRAIIVGATSGIGNALARILLEQGYKVGCTGRRRPLLEELQREFPHSVSISNFDSTVESNALKLNELVTQLGGLDLLVLSSGTGHINESLQYELEKETNLLNVNAFTEIVTWAFHYFEEQGHGHLVGISSLAGIRGQRGAPAYNASKAYQINYLEGLRQKAKHTRKPIYITDIRPGFVDTAMAKGEGQFWVAPKEKAARQIYRHIQRKRGVAYVTKRWWLMAKILKIIPNWLYKRL